ncbi:unnamed protein product [Oppiella nova]|uniref:Lipase domain-containing protein n=1 Tax=Oppiella nova TaxID=334625 RepID=A0A7R9LHN0_9ACAR|nr:unnamed protein product [Oppiella nova]CAG2163753.1 unnamed protein product [Oppiella nova]
MIPLKITTLLIILTASWFDLLWTATIPAPQKPEQINTRFLLFTRNVPKVEQVITLGDRDGIKLSDFDAGKPTKFIIHGYATNLQQGPWMLRLKDLWLDAGDYNVFIVDWSGGANGQYEQAIANTRVVGNLTARMINDLKSVSGLGLSKVHLLGHSLGAHISGFAGQALNGLVGRITGLDPAGPQFDGLSAKDRLDHTDGQFVDVIHSDATKNGGLGTLENSGHLDFFPNGGHDQPGCLLGRLPNILTHGLSGLTACNHLRAIDFYMATISGTNPRGVGYLCSDYDTYRRGGCPANCAANAANCATIGEEAIQWKPLENQTLGRRYFLTTSALYPYF